MSTIQEARATLEAHYQQDGTMTKLHMVKVSTLDLVGLVEVIEVIANPRYTTPSFRVPESAVGVGWDSHRVVLRRMGVVLADSGAIGG